MGDEAPLASSVSRTYNLYEASGIPIEAFVSFLYEARSITREYQTNITKRRTPTQGAEQGGFWPAGKNKMPYFFEILEQLTTGRGGTVPADAP